VELSRIKTITTDFFPPDKVKYGPDTNVVRPERWLDKDNTYEVPLPYHFSYGAAAWRCTAVTFTNRILYASFFKLILSVNITASSSSPATTDYVNYNRDREPRVRFLRILGCALYLAMRGLWRDVFVRLVY
jgi:hypothetical protein